MDKFNIGDRVIGNGNADKRIDGMIGTVVVINDNYNILGVSFDEPSDYFHNLDGSVEYGHGWWCLPDELVPLPSEIDMSSADMDSIFI